MKDFTDDIKRQEAREAYERYWIHHQADMPHPSFLDSVVSNSYNAGRSEMREADIKHMVDRFLGWKLPKDFFPDGGISFKAVFNEHTDHPMKAEPVGTNLFTADQAKEMVEYMLDEAGKEELTKTA